MEGLKKFDRRDGDAAEGEHRADVPLGDLCFEAGRVGFRGKIALQDLGLCVGQDLGDGRRKTGISHALHEAVSVKDDGFRHDGFLF